MKFKIPFILSILIASSLLAVPWTHLELGAGNYGEDGHTQKSQKMTVLMQLKASSQSNYVDTLAQENDFCCLPEIQYRLLFDTVDRLVTKYGSGDGVFQVNDYFEEYSDYAVERLKDYAARQGYENLIIESIPGDYAEINAEATLAAYGLSKYDSVHLKNPEVSFFHDTMDGDELSATDESRRQTRRLLQHLANLSEFGLHYFTVYNPNFIPESEQHEFMEKGIFYEPADDFEPVPYYFPEGQTIPAAFCRVFFIRSSVDFHDDM